MAESATLDRAAKAVEVSYKVSEGYLQLMRAQKFVEVAQTGVQQVTEHLKRAQQFYAAGVIGRQDVLKAQLELARSRQQLIQARYGVSLAKSALALQLGLSMEEPITPTERLPDPPPPAPSDLDRFIRRALENRDDLKSIERKEEAARADARRTFYDLIPQISGVATYQNTQGQGVFFPQNAFFAGGVLKWELWDWGNKYYSLQAAKARVQQAEVGEQLMREGVSLQTKKAFLDLQQSEEELGVARAAIQEAEENFRIEQRRFEANANTSTDVLDAQLALTRAQLAYTTSLYGHKDKRINRRFPSRVKVSAWPRLVQGQVAAVQVMFMGSAGGTSGPLRVRGRPVPGEEGL
jgi:outer membrane protein TolC